MLVELHRPAAADRTAKRIRPEHHNARLAGRRRPERFRACAKHAEHTRGDCRTDQHDQSADVAAHPLNIVASPLIIRRSRAPCVVSCAGPRVHLRKNSLSNCGSLEFAVDRRSFLDVNAITGRKAKGTRGQLRGDVPVGGSAPKPPTDPTQGYASSGNPPLLPRRITSSVSQFGSVLSDDGRGSYRTQRCAHWPAAASGPKPPTSSGGSGATAIEGAADTLECTCPCFVRCPGHGLDNVKGPIGSAHPLSERV